MVKQLQIEIDNVSLKCGDIIYENDTFFLKCLFCEKSNILSLKQFTEHILTIHLKQSNDNISQIDENHDDLDQCQSWKTVILENDNVSTSCNEDDGDVKSYDNSSFKDEIEYLDSPGLHDYLELDHNETKVDYTTDLLEKKFQLIVGNSENKITSSIPKAKSNAVVQLPSRKSTQNIEARKKNVSKIEKEKLISQDISNKYSMEDLIKLSSIKKGLFQCGLCPKIYNKYLYLMRHLKDHLNGPGECSICGKFYTFKRYLIEHYRYAHKESELALRKKEKDISKIIDGSNKESNKDITKLEIEIDNSTTDSGTEKNLGILEEEDEKHYEHESIENSFYIVEKGDEIKEIEDCAAASIDNKDYSKNSKCSILCKSNQELERILSSTENMLENTTDDEDITSFNTEYSVFVKRETEMPVKKKMKFTSVSPIRRSLRTLKPTFKVKESNDILPIRNSLKLRLCQKKNQKLGESKNLLTEVESEKEYSDNDLDGSLKHLNITELLSLSTNENGEYCCVFCNKEFNSINTKNCTVLFKKHLNNHLAYDDDSIDMNKLNTNRLFTTKEFKKDFNKSLVNNKILKTHFNECPLCTDKFETEDVLKEHLKTHLAKNKSTSIRNKKLTLNRNKKSNTKQCEICQRIFKYHHELKAHAEAHIPDKLKCDRCGKRYPNEWSLRDHIEWHTGYGYKCSECGAEFFEEHLYNRHLKEHFGINIYPCSYNCGRRFLSSTFKRKHERIVHLKLAIFQCELCGRKFMQAGQLNTHRATAHSDARPFSCDICNKTFKVYPRLTRHKIVVHSTELAYQCQICNTSFKALSNLRQHEKIHSSNKEYECEHCKSKFSQAAGLYSHLKVKHKVENPSARKRKPSDEYTVEYIDEDYNEDINDENIDYVKEKEEINPFERISYSEFDKEASSQQYEIIYEDSSIV